MLAGSTYNSYTINSRDRSLRHVRELRKPRSLTELLGRTPTDADMQAILDDVNFDAEGVFKGFGNLTRPQVAEMFEAIR